MFELVFLGTSASAPSVKRNLPALVVKHDEYRFLVDCGEGTQRQILQSGIGFKRLNHILITHGHLDHILGLAGLISTLMRWETMEEMKIFGAPGALERIRDLIFGVVLRGTTPPTPIQLIPLSPGTFWEAGDFSISAFPVSHRGPDSLGYLFEHKGRRPFLPENAEKLGIPPGPWRRQLAAGDSITLPDGRKIEAGQVLGELRPGLRLAVVGDTGDAPALLDACRSVNALVIEATYLEEEAELARQFSHLTARQAAELARQAGVRRLFLTHISRRYREKEVVAEAQEIFPETSVARDFDVFTIKQED